MPALLPLPLRANSTITPEKLQAEALEKWESIAARGEQARLARKYGTTASAVSAALSAAREGVEASRHAAVYGYILEDTTPYTITPIETVEYRVQKRALPSRQRED